MLSNFLQSEKANCSISVTPSGIVMLSSSVQEPNAVSPIIFTLLGISYEVMPLGANATNLSPIISARPSSLASAPLNFSRERQSVKAHLSTASTLLGISIVLREWQAVNALSEIFVSPLGKVTLFRSEFCTNTLLLSIVTSWGIYTSVRAHDANAASPISVMLDGRSMRESLLLLSNALTPIDVTLLGSVIEVRL